MAIKKLQNDFTTPEQSKRLLELGVPADSANIHYHQECVRIEYGKEEFEYFLRYGKPDTNKYSTDIPCWSVGRLMKIYLTCALECHPYDDFYTETPSLHFTAFDKDRLIEEVIRIMSEDKMDFSKLEE